MERNVIQEAITWEFPFGPLSYFCVEIEGNSCHFEDGLRSSI